MTHNEETSMTTVVVPERLAAVKDIPLTVGSHTAPPKGAAPCGLCIMEAFAYITGQDWTDSPDNCCSTIGAFLRRYNDSTDQATRDQLGEWVFTNVERIARTARDGHREARGYLAADYAIRTSLPVWLDLAGATEAAASVRALPPVTDPVSARIARDLTYKVRAGLPDYWTWRQELRAKVRAAVLEALKDKPGAAAGAAAGAVADAAAVAAAVADAVAVAAAVADADAVAVAVAVAAAVAVAVAVAAADAVAVAAADAVAVAVAAADAVAVAAADADADAVAAAVAAAGGGYWETYDAVYKAVKAAITEKLAATHGEQWEPAQASLKAGAFELLEAMVSLSDTEKAV